MVQRIKYIVYFLISCLYSILMTNIPVFILRDRRNYYNYALDTDIIFNRNLSGGVVMMLANEPLFLLLNFLFKDIVEPIYVAQIFSFFISLVLIYFFLRVTDGFILKLLILLYSFFVPFLFHFQLVTIRQGLATAILIIVTMCTSNFKRWILAAFILGFIHSSFFLVFMFFVIMYLVRNKEYTSQILVYVISSLIFSILILFVGSILGARQVQEYGNEASSSSGLSFLLYACLLFIILSRGESFLKNYKYSGLAIMGLTVYLSLYFISPFAGRLIISFLPFIFCTLFKTSKKISYFFIIVFLVLNIIVFKKSVMNNSLVDEYMLYF